MQRFRSVSFSKSEFEIARAALTQASRLAGSGCIIRYCLPPACEVVLSSGVLGGCGRRLHRSLTAESDDLDRQQRRFQSSQEALGQQEEEGGGGGTREEAGGRSEGEGGRRKDGGGKKGRGRGGSSSQTVQSVDYLFSRSLLAASRIM